MVAVVCSFSFAVKANAEGMVDVTSQVSASNWVDQNELKITYLDLGAGVVPDTVDYGVIDGAYQYAQDYIAINGRTVKEINTDASLGASEWTYTVFPASVDAKYKLPIIIYENKGKFEIKIHGNYVATLGEYVEITAKAGLYFENAGTRYEVTEDRAFVVHGVKPNADVDITEQVSVANWADQSELKITYLTLGTGVVPDGVDYGVIDKDHQYAQDYIAINGRTVKEINTDASLGASEWTYTVFPSSVDAKYKLPIIIYENGGKLEIKIHGNYVAMLGDCIEVTIKAGLYFENMGTRYKVTEDRSFIVWQDTSEKVDVTESVSIEGWAATGDASELTYTRIYFGEGVLPENIDYGIIDKNWTYLQEYILLNGKTVKEINETTDVSGYVFSTFPSTADVKYQLPIIIFENAGALELKIHNQYLSALGEDLKITIKEGLTIVNGNAKYSVSNEMCFALAGGVWSDINRVYTVTYFINGEQYGASEEYLYNTPFVLRADPEIDKGYAFSGWEYAETATVVRNMEIHGYKTPIRYAITYHLNGGTNHSVNPIVYYVTDGEVVLKDATKEGAVFKGWYTSEDYTQKVEKISLENAGDMELYALFEETKSGGCSSTTLLGSSLLGLVGLAFVLKKKKR